MTYVALAGLSVHLSLERFIEGEALPASGVDSADFWRGLSWLVDTFSAENRRLLGERQRLQGAIDAWHRTNGVTSGGYREYLESIGYLAPRRGEFSIATESVDREVSMISGPQLVVPLSNARYALNACNARWGSLYDALYGTDALGDAPRSQPAYDPERGARVIAWVRSFLDDVAPLKHGSHADVDRYAVSAGQLFAMMDDRRTSLSNPTQLAGFVGDPANPNSIYLRRNGIHLQMVIDGEHPIGAIDRANVRDVVLESAVTAIIDCEDSVAAVDADEKVAVYRNWLGLMRGDLTAEVTKDGRSFTRRLVADREITAPGGEAVTLPGRALLMVRNVGHLMTTDAVLDRDGREVPEGFLDAMVTVLAAKHDLSRGDHAMNSRRGSVYVVKPKMHGPAEVAFADDVFSAVEEILGLPRWTVKIGLMDEERRTSANLGECIRAVRNRLAFINTGFLDRTGDEIHTSMHAGSVVRKSEMRNQRWLSAYEDNNVSVGLACGLAGRAQIGKGMWPMPDMMHAMLSDKVNHPMAGATSAWVPSPTAATLHATHYWKVDVRQRQMELAKRQGPSLDDLLTIPIVYDIPWSAAEIQDELENNIQGILGYVVRWVDQGVGCSKVPDIHDVALMEDRATCRISSQHIANWMLHGVVDHDQVVAAFRKMANVVDRQNAGDPAYRDMGSTYEGLAFRAACELVFDGVDQPCGYTEPILHRARRALVSESADA